jgi:D-tyrosyl-tRNA(Tyr) deacylase
MEPDLRKWLQKILEKMKSCHQEITGLNKKHEISAAQITLVRTAHAPTHLDASTLAK